jgi:hypothetical protein
MQVWDRCKEAVQAMYVDGAGENEVAKLPNLPASIKQFSHRWTSLLKNWTGVSAAHWSTMLTTRDPEVLPPQEEHILAELARNSSASAPPTFKYAIPPFFNYWCHSHFIVP